MAASNAALTPESAADQLATVMLSAFDVHREVLIETAETAERGQLLESGRTACGGGSARFPPSMRRPRSVSLRRCPSGATGIWHTHVTQDQLRNPTHSLPDVANVVFEGVDASVVVGSETSEAVIRPSDPDAAAAAFREAVGINVRSTRDVVRALTSGRIDDPAATRQRVRSMLAGIHRRQPTPHEDLNQRLSVATIPGTVGGHAPGQSHDHDHADQPYHPCSHEPGGPTDPFVDIAGLRQQSRGVADTLRGVTAGVEVRQVAVSNVVTILASKAVERVLGG